MRPILTYYDIADNVTAFSTTRHGGVSRGSYASFNINRWCGDEAEAIAANRKALASELGITADRLFVPHQVHGTVCRMITDEHLGMDSEAKAQMLEGVDSVMTDVSGICIGVSTADCIPVLLYDRRHRAAAAVHAGWRGTVQRIVETTVRNMEENYATRPDDIKAVIGPGISLKNFEVGQEVYDEFERHDFDMSSIARQFPANGNANNRKWHIDLPLCNQLQLEHAGVSTDSIVQTGICTYDHTADYFSARRLGIASGRIFTGIKL